MREPNGRYYEFPESLMDHPTTVLCVRCYNQGFAHNCLLCMGTGREPVPFSEVWGL